MHAKFSQLSPATRGALIGVALAAFYVLGMVNFWVPTVRFSSPLANAVLFALLQLLPFSLLIFNPLAQVRGVRVLSYIALALLSGFAGMLGFATTLHTLTIAASGIDATFERLDAVSLPASRLAIYRTNGGAMTSFGITVREECSLLPGLLRVRDVWGAYPAAEAQIQVLDPRRVLISSRRQGGLFGAPVEVSLKPLWCWTAA